MFDIVKCAEKAKLASYEISALSTADKNRCLFNMADALLKNAEYIISENRLDCEKAKENGIPDTMIDRLLLDETRINAMAEGIRLVAGLSDPVGDTESKILPNGLKVGKMRVPLGLVGIIYESRPNVTSDAASLCFKAGNAVLLRGGKEAYRSNVAIIKVLKEALEKSGVNPDAISFVEDTSHETAEKMMKLNGIIDVLIPRGGAKLIKTVVNNATVPVIETGVGNCHIFVDEFADIDMALEIAVNAKTSRPSVCNAAESMLVHEKIADEFLPRLKKVFDEKSVEIRGCEKVCSIIDVNTATEEDFKTEYLGLCISVKMVSSVGEAISHINRYGTGHSEAIITDNYTNSQKFLAGVDAAAVYVNASTRFTDGFEFGFGAEIGISTQKLHARGPMGLKELTTGKYIIYGNGQVR